MTVTITPIKPLIGSRVEVDRARLCDDDVVAQIQEALEARGVLVFPGIDLTDEEQLSLTDKMGQRVNFTRRVPGSDATAQDVYHVTLNKKVNQEPDYVLATFFWHIDGVTMDIPLPKGTLLSARALAPSGGSTEFANLYAAYEALPGAEKAHLNGLRAIHTLEASLRPVHGHPTDEKVELWRSMTSGMELPVAWTHDSGRTSLILGSHADGIVGMPGPQGRALLTRLQQWAAQPDFVYCHDWEVGDLVIWDNLGLMHRVVPYVDEGRSMHRTTLASREKPGTPITLEAVTALHGTWA